MVLTPVALSVCVCKLSRPPNICAANCVALTMFICPSRWCIKVALWVWRALNYWVTWCLSLCDPRSEYQVWKLFLLLLSQYMHPTGGPNAYEVIYELTACQSVLLKEQFDHSLALLLDLLVSFAHTTFCLFLMNTHVKSAV